MKIVRRRRNRLVCGSILLRHDFMRAETPAIVISLSSKSTAVCAVPAKMRPANYLSRRPRRIALVMDG
jgi:hypothetical protein